MSVLNNKYKIINNKSRPRRASALILAIVLTTLLAIVAVIFLISSRVESVSTSSIADNENLKLAVDTVISQISEDLSLDVSGAASDPNRYADYPDPCNPWLACIEPYRVAPPNIYHWRHISDIYGILTFYNLAEDVPALTVMEYQPIVVERDLADADGDGVTDSRWVRIWAESSSKGKDVFAAIRIIDNSAMLNVNTGYEFNSISTTGSSPLDVDIMSLSWRPNDLSSPYAPIEKTDLRIDRSPVYSTEASLPLYEQAVIWNYATPDGNVTPFDISDELEMRYRFLLNQEDVDTRLDDWGGEFRDARVNSTPYADINEWFKTSCIDANAVAPPDREYAYRHVATAYNLDRIIDPAGNKMLNINAMPVIDPNLTRDNIATALVSAGAVPSDANFVAAQLTANLIDYVDGSGYPATDPRYDPNNNVAVVYDTTGVPHFGFERPCIYLSELTQNFYRPGTGDPNFDPNNPEQVYRSYAIELYKPYSVDWPVLSGQWFLNINSYRFPVVWPGNSSFLVMWNVDSRAPLDINLVDANQVNDLNVVFNGGYRVALERNVGSTGFITVDEINVPGIDPCSGWLVESNDINQTTHSVQRDISPHQCIRRLWESPLMGLALLPTLGGYNNYFSPDRNIVQAHPENMLFTNVGQLDELFYTSTYGYGGILSLPPAEVIEPNLRIDVNLPVYQRLFNYLTVFDPNEHGNPETQTRIKGRININTAPWFVIAQLPWVSQRIGQPLPDYRLARWITTYRDTIKVPRGFQSIGELMRVGAYDPDLFYYGRDTTDLNSLPDLTPSDAAVDDFEERDAIFARLSNLVTVRSDVFTAYILVRIGPNGPQKRVIAILDRSGVTPNPAGGYTGKVKVIAVQTVPDPR